GGAERLRRQRPLVARVRAPARVVGWALEVGRVGGQAGRVGVRVEAVARVVKGGGEADVPVGGVAEGPVVRELVLPDVVAEGLVVTGLGGGVIEHPAMEVRARGWRLLGGQAGVQVTPERVRFVLLFG